MFTQSHHTVSTVSRTDAALTALEEAAVGEAAAGHAAFAPAAVSPYLRADGVSRTYGERRVLTDVSLTVAPGRRLGLIGENDADAPAHAHPDAETDDSPPDYPRARAALEAIGQVYDPRFTAVAQFERALAAVEDAGIPMTDERLTMYAQQLRAIAEFDLSRMPRSSPQAAVEYAVLGTALYEPIVIAMRRLAHQDIASRMLAAE